MLNVQCYDLNSLCPLPQSKSPKLCLPCWRLQVNCPKLSVSSWVRQVSSFKFRAPSWLPQVECPKWNSLPCVYSFEYDKIHVATFFSSCCTEFIRYSLSLRSQLVWKSFLFAQSKVSLNRAVRACPCIAEPSRFVFESGVSIHDQTPSESAEIGTKHVSKSPSSFLHSRVWESEDTRDGPSSRV